MKTLIFHLCYFSIFLTLNPANICGQILQSGYDRKEYQELLKINQKAHIARSDWLQDSSMADPQFHQLVYRSPTVAFDNRWDLWQHQTKPIVVIAVRGSIQTGASFLANLYAAMIPASGSLSLDPDFNFHYQLSDHPQAAVHVGWFVAMAYLSKDILPKIDSCYQAGIKDFVLTGHSQGGGITFLLTAHLYSLQKQGVLPSDIRFKTYCSAGPKPGNLFFAYSYENQTRDWAFNVVNPVDWVPDVPFTVQTVDDFTAVNPFREAHSMIKKQKFPKSLALKHIYHKLSKPSLRAQKNYQRYLGKMLAQTVRKNIPDFITPEYYRSNYYVRTGTTITLYPDTNYFQLYKEDPTKPNIWLHH
ncbi:MAG: lipase family protein, partial [Saprospiraceae bacterium]|nr:lipase family protein [Saprospiraceae bacterium]